MNLSNINNLLKAYQNTTANVNNSQQQSNSGATKVSAGVEMLQNMAVGDTFQGDVINIKDNQVTLALQPGVTLTATLSSQAEVEIGKNLTFVLENNLQNSIAIKPLAGESQEIVMADKALTSANLPFTERNFEMVKELVRQNMPIDKNTLNNTQKLLTKYPDVDVKTLVQMSKLDIPVTADNIAQFKAYQSYESSIFNDVKSMGEQLPSLLSDAQNAGDLLKNLTDALYSQSADSSSLANVINSDEADKLTQVLKENVGEENANKLSDILKKPDSTVKQFLEELSNVARQESDNPEIKNLFKNDAIGNLLKEALNENLNYKLDQGFDKEKVKEFFEKSDKILKGLQETFEKSGSDTQIAKNTQNIRQNIEFMNDINKNMAYFQMPIKFSEGQGNGELYVFADKKKLAQKSDNLSALLHLDMDHLGPMDVLVRLAGKNVSTNFTLENEEMLDFIYSRMDLLTARLEELGYSTKVDMKVKENAGEKIDFVQDFLENGEKPVEITQYLFDIKA